MISRLQSHAPGLIYTGLLMLVGLTAMNNQNNLMFWVLGVLVAGLAVSAIISNFVIRSLRIRRIDPQHGSVGEPLIVRYAVENRSRLLSAFNIHVEERDLRMTEGQGQTGRNANTPIRAPLAWLMHIGPRDLVHGEAIFWPTQRGTMTFDVMRTWTTFPFGIIRKSRKFSQPQHTLIYPMMYELRAGLLGAITPKGFMGTKVSHHAGAGDDYYGTREYKPGDSMRHISWKRTARMDQLVTIERTSPSPAKMRIILDLTIPTEKLRVEPAGFDEARALEEKAISLAASIFHAADMDGYEIGLTVLGLTQPPIAVRRNQWHFHKIMAALAGLDLDSARIEARTQPIRDAERAALVVISPDRVQPITGGARGGREDAWYLTGRQLTELAIKPIGWDPNRGRDGSSTKTVEADATPANPVRKGVAA